MLFWIFVGAFIIVLVLVYLLRDTDIPLEISATIATLLGMAIMISLCIMACNYIGIDAKVSGYQIGPVIWLIVKQFKKISG